MVVFTCQNCGDSLQKPKVEKHYNSRCRNRYPKLTCVDCLKDFNGQEYNNHTKCVTEAERYAAHGTVGKVKKGETKQARFIEMIPDLLNSKNLTTSQRKLLTVCTNFENVPRKRQKFINFILNAGKSFKPTQEDVNSVFDVLETALTELKNKSSTVENKPNHNTSANDVHEGSVKELNGTCEEMTVNNSVDDLSSKPIKKKKDKSNSSSVEEDIEPENKDCVGAEEESKENANKLSKKQLKKQKKYEKYLAELETETRPEMDENMELGESFTENNKKSKKKSKKSKIEQSDSNSIEQQNGNDSTNATEVISENKGHKKSKKRKLDEPICDVSEKKTKQDTNKDDEPISQETFNWADVITRVLESRPDKELSLKRLSKKVIDEYQTTKSDHRTYEELSAKFNKKVKTTKGVKVFKDKAKLIEECRSDD
uniref:Uncharacterized protein n=1 Tax=Graphocephala atropunctata TaxID=36148 RepID=A0A1B6LLZ9_9HEMI